MNADCSKEIEKATKILWKERGISLIRCENCGKEIVHTFYWSDPKFHEEQNGIVYYFCNADCSTKFVDKKNDGRKR